MAVTTEQRSETRTEHEEQALALLEDLTEEAYQRNALGEISNDELSAFYLHLATVQYLIEGLFKTAYRKIGIIPY